MGLEDLPTEILARILGFYIDTQHGLSQHFAFRKDKRPKDYITEFKYPPANMSDEKQHRMRMITDAIVTPTEHMKLMPYSTWKIEPGKECILMEKPYCTWKSVRGHQHAVFFVSRTLRNAYLFEIRNHIQPIFYLNYVNANEPLSPALTGPDEVLYSARYFKLELWVKTFGLSPSHWLPDEELLTSFVEKFRHATEVAVEWNPTGYERPSYFIEQQYREEFNTKLAQIMMRVSSVKKIEVGDEAHRLQTFFKLRCGQWTTDKNKANMEVIRDQMRETARMKALTRT
jgi:hypothetical protein